ncbi:MAG TPA: molybdate ABC transporter substrate-binding protein, partial [Nitrolancea sp.]|nr:molybdate ABC transporter substrate-binding protein [Nitrolancea sp.]
MPKGNGPDMRRTQPRFGWNRSLRATFVVFLMIFVLVLAACGGASTATTEQSERTASSPPSTAASASPATAVPKINGTVTVFAAASLTDAFNEMGKALETA